MKPQNPQMASLKTLRDEVMLKLHLAGMDLKTEWEKLEPQVERAVSSASIVSSEVLADLERRVVEFRSRLEAKPTPRH
jgi:hypothetical protein